jgi:hypothetical protein
VEVRLRLAEVEGVCVTRIRDIANEARSMGRFDFIANFVAGATRNKEQRKPVDGWQLRRIGNGWGLMWNGMYMTSAKTSHEAYEAMRRGELNFYVRQAEDLRADVLTEEPALPPGTVRG